MKSTHEQILPPFDTKTEHIEKIYKLKGGIISVVEWNMMVPVSQAYNELAESKQFGAFIQHCATKVSVCMCRRER